MEFVDILIAIGFIGYIFVALRKKKSSAKRTNAPAKTGWLSKLEGFIEDVKKEMEQAASEQDVRQPDAYLDGVEPMEEDIPDFFAQESQSMVPPPLPCEEPYSEQEIIVPPAVETCSPKTAMNKCEERGQNRKRQMNRKRLQEAVVWSEILSPPIALKEP